MAYLQKIAANPDYARTNEGIQEFQNVITYVDKAQQATKNIGKTAEIVLGHPDDMTIDESINDVVSRGDLEGFKKLNGGNEFYELGLGTKGVMNLNEMNKFANQRAYGNPEPDPRVRKVGDLMIADEVVKANLANHKADALLYYESHPFAAKEWENKGGFEAAYKMLEQPTDKYKTIYTGQVQKGKGGSGGDWNKSGNINVKSYTRDDGATVHELKENTSTNETKMIDLGNGVIADPVIIEKDGKIFLQGKVMELDKSGKFGLSGKAEYSPTGKIRVAEVTPDDIGLTIMGKLSNLYGNIPDVEIVNGKWGDVVINENVNRRDWDNKGLKQNAAPAKKTAKYPLPKGKPATVKQGQYTYTWNEATGQYE